MLIDGLGWINSNADKPIELILKNGEMAHVEWFKQGDTEYNGKYVVVINYDSELKQKTK